MRMRSGPEGKAGMDFTRPGAGKAAAEAYFAGLAADWEMIHFNADEFIAQVRSLGTVDLEQTSFVDSAGLHALFGVGRAAKDAGAPISLKGFKRFQLGEGIEKKESDFAAEVAAAAGTNKPALSSVEGAA